MMNNTAMMSDGLSDDDSSPESHTYDENDLLNATDEVMAQLAAAGLSQACRRLHK